MDYQIASRNILFISIVIGLIYIGFGTGKALVFHKDSVTLCSNGQSLTAVIQSRDAETILFPSKSLKDTLSCLGRAMVFFDRTIEYIHTYGISSKNMNELSKRYHIGSIAYEPTWNDVTRISATKDTVVIKGVENILVFRNSPRNPFAMRDLIEKSPSQTAYLPETGDAVEHVFQKALSGRNSTLYELQEGDWIQFEL